MTKISKSYNIDCVDTYMVNILRDTAKTYKALYDGIVDIVCYERNCVCKHIYTENYKILKEKHPLPSRVAETAYIRACTSVCNYNKLVKSADMNTRDRNRLIINHIDMLESESEPTMLWNSERLHLPTTECGDTFYHLTPKCIREFNDSNISICANTVSTWMPFTLPDDVAFGDKYPTFYNTYPKHKILGGKLSVDNKEDVAILEIDYEIPDSDKSTANLREVIYA